ncbi:hypothetical protein [Flammeovirga agarivorans]|uniref:Uncharacterized protein n=1 Tax=Flammeovirga agarivorans TaxID=2726742 RepID=A0A7X8SGH3_9BACT|nr:hypothetical protein [Flammeovirga agarivorans]NLR89816.1 hypothetical protein [Flammeovirga agarivorans]
MNKSKFLTKLLLYFPITGVLGMHNLYLMRLGPTFVQLFAWGLTLASMPSNGGDSPFLLLPLGLWVRDIFRINKIFKKVEEQNEKDLAYLIDLFDQGKLTEALKFLTKKGRTQILIKELIKRGHGNVLVKHFADTEKDKRSLEKKIKNGDTESLAIFLSAYYLKSRVERVF